jgi:dihydropteroate synthase
MAQNDILKWQGGSLDFTSGCLVMGILNVTPDSFSDGGQFPNVDAAVAYGIEMAKAGAAIIDIGPESTRPGSDPVSTAEQIARAIPVIEQLTAIIDIPVSIDTKDPAVAAAALDAGASIINDVTALADDRMAKLAAERQVPVILMHMQGTPDTMQKEPYYDDVVSEVLQFLLDRAKRAQDFGIRKEMIFIDPGIGFGKTFDHNIELLRHTDRFVASGYRVLLGTSRKRFIGQLTNKNEPSERVFGTAATVALAAAQGAAIVRVHDVAQMVDVVRVANLLNKERS